MIKYISTTSFEKDLKRLLKKFRTLKEDLKVAKKNAIELYHIQKIDNGSVEPISGFCNDKILICKIRKFACKALKGRGNKSGIRVIYAYYINEKLVEFIEIYFKGEKINEDQERMKKYLDK
jgi:mRNA-degrading endonuclease RelE of RelBE toxin-antitoxin system